MSARKGVRTDAWRGRGRSLQGKSGPREVSGHGRKKRVGRPPLAGVSPDERDSARRPKVKSITTQPPQGSGGDLFLRRDEGGGESPVQSPEVCPRPPQSRLGLGVISWVG